jgi:signal transduction histidine kinase
MFKGLSSKIYIAFLVTAVVPVMVAGIVGVYYSVDALRHETLNHLDQEVTNRAAGMARFFDQLTSELLYLASSSLLRDLADGMARGKEPLSREVRLRLERDYMAFAKAYPYIYQVRFLSANGREVVRVDRRNGGLYVTPEAELQDKSDRYYVQEGMSHEAGQVYVSPLDLNVERGQVEKPERPVIRFATAIVDRHGRKQGLLVINLHAAFILGQIQEMAGSRGGVAYLFDRSGFFISRTAEAPEPESFRMQSVEALASFLPRPLLGRILNGERGTEALGDWIVAHAPIAAGRTLAERSDTALAWEVALAFPRKRLFEAVFNLYILYGVLVLSLVATAVAGFLLSRHMLRPLTLLGTETEAIAKGNFSRRVKIRGQDEIADLGTRFNAMAGELERSYRALEDRKGELENEVGARTAALDRERRSLATIIENTADGILALDGGGRIELANAAAESLLAGKRQDLSGRHIDEFWTDWNAYIQGEAVLPSPARRFDLNLLARTLSLNITRLGPDDARAGFILVVRDVSDERRIQDARRELDRQMFQVEKMTTLGELAMGLAHEIGNPLAGMKTVVQMLLEEELPESMREYLRRIGNEVDRLSDFLRTFHGFSAPQETHPVPCRLEQALEDVLLWTRKEARSQGVTVTYAPCGGDVPALWADPNQLKQVLLNLVINAIHAMPDGGKIEVGMCAKPEDLHSAVPRMRFCVRDTGAGIPAEVLPRIFDPFFTTRKDGSGLGLAVVKKIAMQHGADVRVESVPGRGTCFELVWPVASTEGVAPGRDSLQTGAACARESRNA